MLSTILMMSSWLDKEAFERYVLGMEKFKGGKVFDNCTIFIFVLTLLP